MEISARRVGGAYPALGRSNGPTGNVDMLDAVGVGIGPFNLSLAALLAPVKRLRSVFYERNHGFGWHPGLLMAEAEIQASFLKDLVTPADPTSRYSFVSFLHEKKRLYRFITAEFPRVTRREFNQYLQWVADSLPNLRFGQSVLEVRDGGDALEVSLSDRTVRTRNVVVGTGISSNIPPCARPHLGDSVFPGHEYLRRLTATPAMRGRTVAVVGGGQSGAEVVYSILRNRGDLPDRLLWISRRTNFLPLDESPFTNELFSPQYSDYFLTLDRDVKARLLEEQKLAGYGIAEDLLAKIYRELYDLEFLDGWGRRCELLPGHELVGMRADAGRWELELANRIGGGRAGADADLVILCTGFEERVPACLEPIADRVDWTHERNAVREDFSLAWDGPPGVAIYLQNASRANRGIADPNLSLMAWRSARIVNSLAGECVYDVGEPSSAFDWAGAAGT